MSRFAAIALLVVLTSPAHVVAQQTAQAQFMEGERYRIGMDGPSDNVKAREWYLKAAAQGHAAAQYQLGMIYNYGRGVAKDPAQAIAWYKKSAAQGDASAALELGEIYRFGRGVPRDWKIGRAHV